MRTGLLLLCLSAAPAAAWEATAGRVCELTHRERSASVRITYDPEVAEYAITIRRATPWPADPVFAIEFEGGRNLTIRTNRHGLADGDLALTVTDRGFGNVLDGLAFNERAIARLGDATVPFTLTGPQPAAPAVAAFRACAEGAIA